MLAARGLRSPLRLRTACYGVTSRGLLHATAVLRRPWRGFDLQDIMNAIHDDAPLLVSLLRSLNLFLLPYPRPRALTGTCLGLRLFAPSGRWRSAPFRHCATAGQARRLPWATIVCALRALVASAFALRATAGQAAPSRHCATAEQARRWHWATIVCALRALAAARL